jgi:hypothetical protein
MATASSIAPTSASWEVPSWSFAASGLAGINAKVDLRFVDVSPDLGVAQLSGMRNDCFGLGVAPFGGSISEEIYRAFKLIDAAASFDAVRDSGKSLSPEQGVVVSLHATKLVSAGEGGSSSRMT